MESQIPNYNLTSSYLDIVFGYAKNLPKFRFTLIPSFLESFACSYAL